jgi:hypothetical protein
LGQYVQILHQFDCPEQHLQPAAPGPGKVWIPSYVEFIRKSNTSF